MSFIKVPNIVLKGQLHDLSTPLVMAVINATDDSFYAASRNECDDNLKRSIEKAVDERADILDVGGCSTRPGSTSVPEDTELERVSHTFSIIRSIAGEIPTSVDTFRASVARLAVQDFGCDIINDISAFSLDRELFSTVVELQKPYILTHYPTKSDGNCPNPAVKSPENLPEDQFLASVLQFYASKIDALRTAGFDNDIIIDPGFGFGKSMEQNYSLLRNLSLLQCFHEPILAGVSRKSMVCAPLGITPDEALNGTSVLNAVALTNGANILRVHDVKEAVEVRKLLSLVMVKK